MLLGLDLGTTAVKAVLLDPGRGLLAADSLPNAPASPKPGWSEQDAEAWLGNALALIPRVCAAAGIDPSAVACVGVAGCVPCVVLLGADDRPLRPALLYNDGRAHAEIDELNAELADARVLQRTGAGITQQSVGPKLRWLQRHEPGVWARTRRVAGSYDWLAGQLTEVGFSERNWALESGLYDLGTDAYAPDLCASVGVRSDLFGPIHDPADVVGCLSAAIAGRTGLRVGIPVVAGLRRSRGLGVRRRPRPPRRPARQAGRVGRRARVQRPPAAGRAASTSTPIRRRACGCRTAAWRAAARACAGSSASWPRATPWRRSTARPRRPRPAPAAS